MAQDISDLFSMLPKDTGGLMSLADQGQQALDSGAVSPAEAKAAQKKMGIDTPKKAGDWLSNHLSQGQTPDPLLGGMSQGYPATPKPQGKGVQTKNTQVNEDTSSTKQIRNTTIDPTDSFFEMYRKTPEASAQASGLLNMQAQYDKLAAQRSPDDAWVKPLLALSDNVNGGNQAGAFQSNSEKRNADLAKFANDIQQRRGDITKTMLDSYSKLKSGQDIANQGSKSSTNVFVGTGMNQGGLNSSRLLAMPLRAGADFDKQLAPATKAIESFNRGEGILNDPNIPLTEQSLNMIQQDVSNGLAGSGQATDAKMAADMMHAIQGKLQTLKQTYGGTIGPEDDLRKKIPDIVNQVHKILIGARQSFNDNVNRQADQIGKTYESSYEDIPNLKETVEAKKQGIRERFPRSKTFNATGQSVTEQPKAKTVSQNGHTYTLNEQTGQYE